MTQDFYDELAPYYHLLYPNWDASIARQSRGLAHVLSEFDVPPGSDVLDAACGIGTQALGLAQLGYRVTASDLSPRAVSRAREEAVTRGLAIAFTTGDLRRLSSGFDRRFPAVIACDNAIPHLLSDDEIRAAFIECRRLLEPEGVLLISVRDYAAIERRNPTFIRTAPVSSTTVFTPPSKSGTGPVTSTISRFDFPNSAVLARRSSTSSTAATTRSHSLRSSSCSPRQVSRRLRAGTHISSSLCSSRSMRLLANVRCSSGAIR
jgi:SAM-dependent methyltransferase